MGKAGFGEELLDLALAVLRLRAGDMLARVSERLEDGLRAIIDLPCSGDG